MPTPNEVNPHNFQVKDVLYNKGGFSIAWGRWESKEDLLAMRWDGDGATDQGYPKTFGHPVWFVLPADLALPIVLAIRTLDGSERDEIRKTLQTLLSAPAE